MSRRGRHLGFAYRPAFAFDPAADAGPFGGESVFNGGLRGLPLLWQDAIDYADGQLAAVSSNVWKVTTTDPDSTVENTTQTNVLAGRYCDSTAVVTRYAYLTTGNTVALDLSRGYRAEARVRLDWADDNTDGRVGILLETGAFSATPKAGFMFGFTKVGLGTGPTIIRILVNNDRDLSQIGQSADLPIVRGQDFTFKVTVSAARAFACFVDGVESFTGTLPAVIAGRTSPGMYHQTPASQGATRRQWIDNLKIYGYAP